MLFVFSEQQKSNKNSIDSNEESKQIMTPSFTQELSPTGWSPRRYSRTSGKQKRDLILK